MQVALPTQTCGGVLVSPDPGECGAETDNPDCVEVCAGPVLVSPAERLGVIGEASDTFRVYLGAGLASDGLNCVMLSASVADAELVSIGEPHTCGWEAAAMERGVVETVYTGGCMWGGDPDGDGQLEAVVLGARLRFTTGFTGARR